MENLSGKSIKGYELRERIGAGGFGAVYRASQSTVGREVAVKIILPHFSSHPDFIRRFETEAQLVARLEHLHIVPLYDYWRDPDGAYLVMRWLKGGSLRDALSNGPFAPDAAALLLDQVGSALAAAHRNNVIHRDLKPGNILLDEDGNAYLADFGIAKDVGSSSHVTEPDAVVGSPDYLAPEQARAEQVTPRTDIYSLGVVLYEILTGQHPFPNLSMVERLYKHLNDPLPEIDTLPDDIRQSVNEVIQKATAKNPQHRFADTQEFAAAFHAAIKSVAANGNLVESLTQREQQVLRCIIDGLSNGEIAAKLFISITTVRWYIRQIYQKLGVRSRVQAILRARDLNLITPPDSLVSPAPAAIPTDQFQPDNPYKGLRAFQSADHQDFFGREKLIDKLLNRLADTSSVRRDDVSAEEMTTRFLAVIGPSGSGKSSLVKAGLIPAVWRGALPGSEKWFVVEMLPGAHPLEELEIALTRVAANQVSSLNEHLTRDKRGLLRAASLILPNDGSELLLVIDQFEEVFTLVENENERAHFLDLIQSAVSDPRSRVRVVITLRADFYDRPLRYPQFGELVRSRMETILPLSAEGLERAIARPAERVGVTFEPGLVAAIIGEINYQAGALPLLQYALTELFEQRQGRQLTHEAYQAIGRTTGALAKRAEELYLDLSPEGQEAARQMFLRLVTLGEGAEDTRRRATRSELLAITTDTERMEDIIDTYAEYRLLSLDNDAGTRTPTVEVAHEAILREWQRLRNWINLSREEIKMQQQLTHLAEEWISANKEASYLVSGLRLEQFEKWVQDTKLALTQDERAYLDASIVSRNRQQFVEQEQQLKVAALERRSVHFLRTLVAVLVLATLGAFGLTAAAVNNANQAETNAIKATLAQGDAYIQAQTAIAAQATSEQSFREAQSIALSSGAQDALRNNQPDLALALAVQANQFSPALIEAQRALADTTAASRIVRRFMGNTAPVLALAVSPDGTQAVSASPAEMLILWNVETGDIIRKFGNHSQTDTVLSVAFSPDGQTILTGAYDGRVVLWDAPTGEVIRSFLSDGHVHSVAFNPDGQSILAGTENSDLMLWNAGNGDLIHIFRGHKAPVYGVAFSPDGKSILSASWDSTLILWDVMTGNPIRTFEGHTDKVNDVDFNSDGKTALSASSDHTLILWNVVTGDIIRRFEGHTEFVDKVAFSPDGQKAISASEDNSLILWDTATGTVLRRFIGHTLAALDVAFSPNGKTVLSASADKTLVLWDVASEDRLGYFEAHTDEIWDIAFSPDGNAMLSASADNSLILWDVKTGNIIRHFTGHTTPIYSVAFSPDGAMAVSGANGGDRDSDIVILWDVATGKIITRLTGNSNTMDTVDFSPDGKSVLAGGAEKVIRIWDTETGSLIKELFGHTDTVTSAVFSQDGKMILSGSADNSLILWDAAMGNVIRKFEGHTGEVRSVAFSPDGKTALSGSEDSTLILWDLATSTIIHRFQGHTSAVYSVAFSPDGKSALSGSLDDSLILWDLVTGNIVHRFLGHTNDVYSVAFSPDGSLAASASADSTLFLWRATMYPTNLVDWVHDNRYVPELTCEQRQTYHVVPLCDTTGTTPNT